MDFAGVDKGKGFDLGRLSQVMWMGSAQPQGSLEGHRRSERGEGNGMIKAKLGVTQP